LEIIIDTFLHDDVVADTTQYNAAIKNVVHRYPDQYGCTYKRFATRPENEPTRYL